MMPGFASAAAEGLFPPARSHPRGGVGLLSTWCDIIDGELLDGIEWDEIADTTGSLAVLRIPPFRLGFQGTGSVHAGLVTAASASKVLTIDKTGWRVGGA